MDRKPIFDALRRMLGRKLRRTDVEQFDRAIDALLEAEQTGTASGFVREIGSAGITLIKSFEGCHRQRADGRFEAYPDPGSTDGRPWTIGWGSTGSDITRGTVWTQAQCDERFAADIQRYVQEVASAIGNAPTSQTQFDALVSFHYNTGAVARATLTKLHKAGLFDEARAQFARWVYNDGRRMAGLVRRRADEAALYAT